MSTLSTDYFSFRFRTISSRSGRGISPFKNRILLTCIFALSFFHANSQDLRLDSTFALNGTYFDSTLRGFEACQLQADGKILVIGEVTGPNSEFLYSIISRINADGSKDMSFGSGGMTIDYQIRTSLTPENIVFQSDGQFLIYGQAKQGSIYKMALKRYSTDGVLDISFGTNGISIIDLSPGNPEGYPSIAVQPDDKIIVAGMYDNIGSIGQDFALIRLYSNGIRDYSFGNSGMVLTDFDNTTNDPESIQLYPDGKIVVVGWSEPGHQKCAIARYESNGSLDNTFNGTGKVVLTLPLLNWISRYNTAIQADGKILISQTMLNNNNQPLFGLFRLNLDGSLDNSFGVNGVFNGVFPTHPQDFCYSFHLLNDGSMVMVGKSRYLNADAIRIVKVTANGIADTSFDEDGTDSLVLNNTLVSASDVVVDQEGKIIVVGSNDQQAFVSRFLLFEPPTSIKEKSLSFDIYPNPLKDVIRISSAEKMNFIRITNALGSIIKEEKVNHRSIDIQLGDIPSGMYFVMIETKTGRGTKQIIKY